VALTRGTPLAIVNANAAIAYDAMKAGSRGFTGVFTNFHPDLYKWLMTEDASDPALADELSVYLALSAMAEPMGYPKLAKLYHQRLGTFACTDSRAVTFDIHEKFWALEAMIDKITEGIGHYQRRTPRLARAILRLISGGRLTRSLQVKQAAALAALASGFDCPRSRRPSRARDHGVRRSGDAVAAGRLDAEHVAFAAQLEARPPRRSETVGGFGVSPSARLDISPRLLVGIQAGRRLELAPDPAAQPAHREFSARRSDHHDGRGEFTPTSPHRSPIAADLGGELRATTVLPCLHLARGRAPPCRRSVAAAFQTVPSRW
jgi:hypothetical protein